MVTPWKLQLLIFCEGDSRLISQAVIQGTERCFRLLGAFIVPQKLWIMSQNQFLAKLREARILLGMKLLVHSSVLLILLAIHYSWKITELRSLDMYNLYKKNNKQNFGSQSCLICSNEWKSAPVSWMFLLYQSCVLVFHQAHNKYL